MNENFCPGCGASLEIREIGQLKDKILLCPYCGYPQDVPDEYEISKEWVIPDGSSARKIKVTERRKDGPVKEPPHPGESAHEDKLDPRDLVEKLKAEGKISRDGVSFTLVKDGDVKNDSADKDSLHYFTAGVRNGKVKLGAGDPNKPRGKLDKLFSRDEELEMPDDSLELFADNSISIGHNKHRKHKQKKRRKKTEFLTSSVRWLVALAAIVLIIVVAIKLL